MAVVGDDEWIDDFNAFLEWIGDLKAQYPGLVDGRAAIGLAQRAYIAGCKMQRDRDAALSRPTLESALAEDCRDNEMPDTFCGDGIARTTVKALRELLEAAPDETRVFLQIADFIFDTVGASVVVSGTGNSFLILGLDVNQSMVSYRI